MKLPHLGVHMLYIDMVKLESTTVLMNILQIFPFIKSFRLEGRNVDGEGCKGWRQGRARGEGLRGEGNY